MSTFQSHATPPIDDIPTGVEIGAIVCGLMHDCGGVPYYVDYHDEVASDIDHRPGCCRQGRCDECGLEGLVRPDVSIWEPGLTCVGEC